jgi:hypothetical protein
MIPARETIARRGPLWVVVLLVAGTALGCRSSPESTASLEGGVDAIKARIVPPAATALVQTSPVRGEWDVRWELEFETEWDWETYKKWARSQLEPEFGLLKETKSRLVFSRTFHGDAQSLVVERLSGSSRTRIQVSVTDYPD